MKKYFSAIIIFFVFNSCDTVLDNNPANNLKGMDIMRMTAEEENLINFFNNKFTDYAFPVLIHYRGEKVRASAEALGAGSRYFPQKSFVVRTDGDLIEGLYEFNLSSQIYDRTMMKTALASYLYSSAGFPVFFSKDIFLTINNENYGVYTFIERVDEEFFRKRNISLFELYKVQFDSKFTFTRLNNVQENFDKDFPDDDGNFRFLEEFINAIDQSDTGRIFEEIGKHLDIENYLMYHAVSSVRNDPDSFTNNFFLYKASADAPFRVIPWDFDKTMFGNIGLYGDNDLIHKLLLNDSCRTIYRNNVRYIVENLFTESALFPIIDSIYIQIKDFYELGPYHKDYDLYKEKEELKSAVIQRREELLMQLGTD